MLKLGQYSNLSMLEIGHRIGLAYVIQITCISRIGDNLNILADPLSLSTGMQNYLSNRLTGTALVCCQTTKDINVS